MNEKHIGSVLVLDRGGMQGIFTERDVMRRVVAEGRDPERTVLRDVMTTRVVCAALHTTLEELRFVMREQRIRHVPVVDGAQVLGMISIGDLNEAEREVQDQTIEYLSSYMSVT
jgi:CBS domain-containing protein